jgi:predicted acylesterase/phospholipase RssA
MQLQGAALERRPQEWTFAQLAAATGRKLLVPIMNMEAESIDVCSPSITPDIPVIQAVYASMAIPVLYCPVWLVLPGMRGAFYCDGGMEMNFPMSLLPPGSALGLCLDGEDVPGTAVPKAAPGHPPRRHQSSFVTSVTRLGRVAAKAAAKFTANQLLQLKDEYLPHVVPLHSGSINALTMFHASQPVFQSIVRSLIASGRHSMEQWIKTSSRGLAMRDFITRLRYFRGRHIVLARAYLAILGLYALAFRGYKLIWSACEHQ